MSNAYEYVQVPKIIRISEIFEKQSMSGKDYNRLVDVHHSVRLGDVVDINVGDTFSSTEFLTEDICKTYRYIKTVNLVEHKMAVDFSSVEYCKPSGTDVLQDGDILIAKDGNGSGLGEVAMYFKHSSDTVDYYSGEVLRVRVKEGYDKWYVFAMLKSKFFKEYIDSVTPGGSTLRHSKLLALDFKFPYPKTDTKNEIKYISFLVQDIIDKELKSIEKRDSINNILGKEVNENQSSTALPSYRYPKISEINDNSGRFDTGPYNDTYFHVSNKIKNYSGGYFHLNRDTTYPGKTPQDYLFTEEKRDNTYLWLTPKNMNSLELLYETYINTSEATKVRDYSIILSGIRYLGYGYFADKNSIIYCNQNTLIVNESNDRNEQIFILLYFTSNIGKKLQYSWRVDGLVPIIYTDDIIKIPIPKIRDKVKEKMIQLYYNGIPVQTDYADIIDTNAFESINSQLGIYQLNNSIIKLRRSLGEKVHNIISKFKK